MSRFALQQGDRLVLAPQAVQHDRVGARCKVVPDGGAAIALGVLPEPLLGIGGADGAAANQRLVARHQKARPRQVGRRRLRGLAVGGRRPAGPVARRAGHAGPASRETTPDPGPSAHPRGSGPARREPGRGISAWRCRREPGAQMPGTSRGGPGDFRAGPFRPDRDGRPVVIEERRRQRQRQFPAVGLIRAVAGSAARSSR